MNASMQWPARTYAGGLSRWCKRTVLNLQQRSLRLLKSLNLKRAFSKRHVFLPQIAIIAGALACGIWLDSAAAGLFGLVLLFFLWKIGRSVDRITGLLRTQSATILPGSWHPSSTEGSSQRSIYISAKAMERLRPWVEDESTLTEESAKAYCSVLLDTLAMLHPKLAGKAPGSESWS